MTANITANTTIANPLDALAAAAIAKPAAAKAVNYTPEQTATLIELWKSGKSPEELGVLLGKTTRSIISKLSREKVGYTAKKYVTKTGAAVQKKDDTADAIGKILMLSENDMESLTKCNKTALIKIFAALANSVPLTPENDTATREAGETQDAMM